MLEWTFHCAGCREPQTFSQHVVAARRAGMRGLPELCPGCEASARRPLRYLPFEATLLESTDGKAAASHSALGFLPHATVEYMSRRCGRPIPEGRFAVKDSELLEFHELLSDPSVRVALAIAKTGAGKSTYIPMRIMLPPGGGDSGAMYNPDGQILITQPRVKSTRDTPFFVAGELVGCAVGARQFYGYRFKDNPYSDWETSLRYVTDGTVVSWLTQELLHRMGLVVIDEAHERSLNIDFIMALLVRALARNPHVKILIASATIDPEAFRAYFDRFLPQGQRTAIKEFSYFKEHEYQKVYRDPREFLLPYVANQTDPQAVKRLADSIHEPLAAKVADIVLRMHALPPLGPVTDSLDLATPEMRGDVLAFLHSKKSVAACIERIEELLAQHPELRASLDLIGLHRDTPANEQKGATENRSNGGKLRVIIATNYAETSLTFPNLKHSIDTGLICQKIWDTSKEQAGVPPRLHSRAGCKQRWGRVGRVSNGVAWMLYSEQQHETLFEAYSEPKILLEEMTPAVLKAAQAGVERVETRYFPWMADDSQREELDRELLRAHHRLKESGLIDDDGDPTPQAAFVESYSSIGNLPPQEVALLMSLADRHCCAIEMAATVAWLARNVRSSKVFEPETETADPRSSPLRDALLATAEDDVAFAIGLWSAYEQVGDRDEFDGDEAIWSRTWDAAALPPMADAIIDKLDGQADAVRAAAGQARCVADLDELTTKVPIPRRAMRDLELWLGDCRRAFVRAVLPAWADSVGVNLDAFDKEIASIRTELLKPLSKNLKGGEDRRIHQPYVDRIRVLTAWANRGHVFQRASGPDLDPLAPFVPVRPRDRAPTVGRLRGSVCALRPCDLFVSVARRVSERTRGGAALRVVETNFAVVVPTNLARALPDLSSAKLSRLVAELSAAAVDDRALVDREAAIATRTRYPVGAVVWCRVISHARDRACHVELGARLRTPAQSMCELARDSNGTSRADGDDVEVAEPEDEPLFAPELPAIKDVEPELETETTEELTEANAEGPRRTAARRLSRVVAIGVIVDAPEGARGEVQAEVFAHDRAGAVRLTCARSREAFAAFARQHRPGEDVAVVVASHEVSPEGDDELHVVHRGTGLRVVLGDNDVTVGEARGACRLVPIGADLRARVARIDTTGARVQLTLRHLADRVVHEALRNGPATSAGRVVSTRPDGCSVLLSGSDPRAGCIVLARINMGGFDAALLKIAEPVALRISRRTPLPFETLRHEPSAADLESLASHGVGWDAETSRLRLLQALSESQREAIRDLPLEPATKSRVLALLQRGEQLDCAPLPMRGQRVAVRVIRVLPRSGNVLCESPFPPYRVAILPARRRSNLNRVERDTGLTLEVLGTDAEKPDQLVLSQVPANAPDVGHLRPGAVVKGRIHFPKGAPAMTVSGADLPVWAGGRRLRDGDTVEGYYTRRAVDVNAHFVAHVVPVGDPNAFQDLVGSAPFEFRQNQKARLKALSRDCRGSHDIEDRSGCVSLFATTRKDVESLRQRILQMLAPEGVVGRLSIACDFDTGPQYDLSSLSSDRVRFSVNSPASDAATQSPRQAIVCVEARSTDALFGALGELANRLKSPRVFQASWLELPPVAATNPSSFDPSLSQDVVNGRLAILGRLGVSTQDPLAESLLRTQPEPPIRVVSLDAFSAPPDLPAEWATTGASGSPTETRALEALKTATERLQAVSREEPAPTVTHTRVRRIWKLRRGDVMLLGLLAASVLLFRVPLLGPTLLWTVGFAAFWRLVFEVRLRTERIWSPLLTIPECAPRPAVLPGAWSSCAEPIVKVLTQARFALLLVLLGWVPLWPLAQFARFATKLVDWSLFAGFTFVARELVFLSVLFSAVLLVPAVSGSAMVAILLQAAARSQSRRLMLPSAMLSRALDIGGAAILTGLCRRLGVVFAPHAHDHLEARRRWFLWGTLTTLAFLSLLPAITSLAGACLRYYVAVSVFGFLYELLDYEIALIRSGVGSIRLNNRLAAAGGIPGQLLASWATRNGAKRELVSFVRKPKNILAIAAHAFGVAVVVWTAFF